MENYLRFLTSFDPVQGTLEGTAQTHRYLADLRGIFADESAYEQALGAGNPLVYSVAGVEYPAESGHLNYAIGSIQPGRLGAEYYMTKGHFHAWRPAAEIYIGLSGEGVMLLESEDGSQAQMLPLLPNHIVYVPGFTAHRTMNTGSSLLTYVGIYPAQAGHDYESIARQNFRNVIVTVDGKPVLRPR